MIWADYSREWKGYQRQFSQMERETTGRQIQEADAAVNQRELQRIEGELATAAQELDAKQAEIAQREDELEALQDRWTLADIGGLPAPLEQPANPADSRVARGAPATRLTRPRARC